MSERPGLFDSGSLKAQGKKNYIKNWPVISTEKRQPKMVIGGELPHNSKV
jgi:hypothetical protein